VGRVSQEAPTVNQLRGVAEEIVKSRICRLGQRHEVSDLKGTVEQEARLIL
jgi:hypothetical protein